jgi:hypothetical protein
MIFLLSPDELAQAAASRVRPYLRRARLIAAAVAIALFLLIGGASGSVGAGVTTGIITVMYYGLLFWLWSPRRVGRATVRRQLRDNPSLASGFTVDVESAGVRVQTATSSAAFSWAHFPYRAEVEGQILLLTSPRRGASAQPLPLRAVAQAHQPRLLALLAEHTQLTG